VRFPAFLTYAAHHCCIISTIDVCGMILNPFVPVPAFTPAFEALWNGKPIKCLSSGKEYKDLPRPFVAIIDVCLDRFRPPFVHIDTDLPESHSQDTPLKPFVTLPFLILVVLYACWHGFLHQQVRVFAPSVLQKWAELIYQGG